MTPRQKIVPHVGYPQQIITYLCVYLKSTINFNITTFVHSVKAKKYKFVRTRKRLRKKNKKTHTHKTQKE